MTRGQRALAIALAGAVAMAVGCGGDDGKNAHKKAERSKLRLAGDQAAKVTKAPNDALAGWRGPVGARLVRRAFLRSTPDGRVVTPLGTQTWFGSDRVLAVAKRRAGWVGVHATQMPNNRIGWLPADAVELVPVPIRVDVDLSDRMLVVRRGKRVVRRVHVAIGRAANPTPTGRYGVTDRLIAGKGSAYGCCILALTGHQTHLPSGWTGGARLAIHGTPDEGSVGQAASSGCLRARNKDARRLLKLVPVGATVVIRA